jgi:Transposase DDE domain
MNSGIRRIAVATQYKAHSLIRKFGPATGENLADAIRRANALFHDKPVWRTMPSRKVPRSIHERARDVAREIAKTDAYVRSRRERKKIEMLFAHLKRILRLDRLRLRGPSGAQDEFLLAATAQNLRKLAKLIPLPTLQPA